MFFDEEMLLDLRLNIMNRYVDKFVITEATYMHSGKPKKPIFDIKKFFLQAFEPCQIKFS